MVLDWESTRIVRAVAAGTAQPLGRRILQQQHRHPAEQPPCTPAYGLSSPPRESMPRPTATGPACRPAGAATAARRRRTRGRRASPSCSSSAAHCGLGLGQQRPGSAPARGRAAPRGLPGTPAGRARRGIRPRQTADGWRRVLQQLRSGAAKRQQFRQLGSWGRCTPEAASSTRQRTATGSGSPALPPDAHRPGCCAAPTATGRSSERTLPETVSTASA
jgi:hypothetical protein